MRTSQAAQVAKLIRQDLKVAFPSVKFRVNSNADYSYVNVYKPATIEAAKVRAIAKKYQFGSFDGMTDTYEFNNVDASLPQVERVLVHHVHD